MMSSGSGSVLFFSCRRFVLVRLGCIKLLRRNMSMHNEKGDKVESQTYSCMAIFHGDIEAGLAFDGPHLDDFMDKAKEEGLLRLVE